MKYLSLLLFLLPITCLAQLKIEGKVVNAADGKPIPDASVFINNTTIGTKAGNEGSFTLYRASSGQYELIVSVVGYETHRQNIIVNGNLTVPAIKMLPKTSMMKEVRIGSDPKWKKKLKEFTEQFIGRPHLPVNSCTILNPEILNLTYSDDEQILTASSNGFLEIDNDNIGYKLKYLLSDFVYNKKTGTVDFKGSVLFEETTKSSRLSSKDRAIYRRNIYIRTPMYFFREVLADRADSNFIVLRNSKKKTDRTANDTLHVAQYIHPTENKGVFAMSGKDDVAIILIMHNPMQLKNYVGEPAYMNLAEIHFIDKYLYFDTNGILLNQMGAVFGWQWGRMRVAELLPADYWPPAK